MWINLSAKRCPSQRVDVEFCPLLFFRHLESPSRYRESPCRYPESPSHRSFASSSMMRRLSQLSISFLRRRMLSATVVDGRMS